MSVGATQSDRFGYKEQLPVSLSMFSILGLSFGIMICPLFETWLKPYRSFTQYLTVSVQQWQLVGIFEIQSVQR